MVSFDFFGNVFWDGDEVPAGGARIEPEFRLYFIFHWISIVEDRKRWRLRVKLLNYECSSHAKLAMIAN